MHLVLHNSYTTVEVALYTQDSLVDAIHIDKHQASSQLLVAIATLCARHEITSKQLEYIVVHGGPGPFTTLRTVLATANGLAFAQGLKLVSVDGLRALLAEHQDTAFPVTVALLNAYSNDLYYACDYYGKITTDIIYGSDALKKILQQMPATTIRFIGNGVFLHEKLIYDVCGMRAHIPVSNPETCSLQAIASQGYQKWVQQEDISNQAVPLYLKKY